MTVARPTTLTEALDAAASLPEADVLAGGTDLAVEINKGSRRPRGIVALRRVAELDALEVDAAADEVRLGAGLTWTRMEHELVAEAPALSTAARTVGSPQIRNAGTLGGNLGTASPAGDALPFLYAADAVVTLARHDASRTISIDEFVSGPKTTALQPGELIVDVRFRRAPGPQQFLKVGARNAMAIAMCSCALILDPRRRQTRCALGAVGPRPLRAGSAEHFANEVIDWDALSASPSDIARFGELVAEAAAPISDHRATARYRRHAVGVIARRALERVLRDTATGGVRQTTGGS